MTALFWIALLLPGLVPAITLERSVALEGGALGSPVPFPSQDAAEAVLVTLASGKIVLLNPAGQPAASMQLDLAPTAPAVLGRLAGKAAPEILAADVAGSIYCFNARGERLWKHTRTGKAADFRVLVVADIDGDGQPEVLLSDSRGHLFAVDSSGRLRLEVTATRYRVSAPAVGDLDGDGVPELVFGTEDNEMYCLNGRGEFLWRRSLEGRFGRALPVLADPERDGKLKVFVSTPFVGPSPGLYSLDGATGAVRWQARSVLQSYHSIAVADVDGDGQAEIFYGDKNTRLFCVNARGQHRWATQLGGRGIFFAPAIAEVEGRARIFQVVRGAGLEGHSLYALDSAGKVVEALALQGGGNSSPRLCRFQGRRELSLLVFDSSKNLLTYRLPEGKILWPAPAPVTARPSPQRASPPRPPVRPLLAGRNTIQLTRPAGGALAVMRVAGPDGAVQVKLAREEDTAGFEAREPGAYDLTLQWFNRDNARLHQERRAYALDSGFSEDARLAGSFDAPASPLAGYFEATAKAGWDLARKQRDIGLLERLRADRAYASALLRYLAREPVRGPVLVRQLANPWAALDPAAFVERPNRLELAMLGNEYESAALAVTNLQTRAADFRIAAGPELKNAVQFREAPLVLPDSIGFPSEDVLPLLGEGQTLRLGPGETRKLWLTFHSRDLPPGEIRSSIRIGDLASQEPPLDAPVVVKVYRTRLPDRLTYRHCNWLYLANISDRAVREAVMRDALEHGTNVFNVPGCSLEADAEGKLGKARTEVHDELVANLRGRAFFLINGSVGLSWPAGAKISREVQDRAYAEALRWYAGHMRSLGVDYAGYAFYLQDEPGLMGQDAGFDQWVEQVRRVKAADARLQIYANPAGGAHAEVLAPVAGLIDVWQPDLHLLRDQPEELGRIFRQGKQYWHYEAPADQRNLHPLGFYRMKPWVAFQLGMTGGGYWVYSGSPYWFFDPGRSTEYGAVYLTDKGPVTTKRWEASRDGAEDFELLWMLRQKARRANSREALRLLDEAVAFVTKDQEQASDIARQLRPYAPDYSRWMEYREKLIRMLETLE